MAHRAFWTFVLVGLVSVLPAEAICGAPFLITSLSSEGYSYVITPGTPAAQNGYGASITENVAGFFWAVGAGNAEPGIGADNGTFPAIQWLSTSVDYPAYLLTNWAASTEIDTCVDVAGPIGERCMAVFLTDLDPGTGRPQFALLSAPDEPASGDFVFVQPGNIPIQLVPLAPIPIIGTSRSAPDEVEIVFGGPSDEALLPGALYLSDAAACQVGLGKSTDPFNGLIVGYRLHRLTLPRGSTPPSEFRRESWEDLGFPPTPLDAPTIVSTGCTEDVDEYYAYSLVFDGAFESPYVSATSSRIECGPNLADPEPRYRVRPPTREGPPRRSNR